MLKYSSVFPEVDANRRHKIFNRLLIGFAVVGLIGAPFSQREVYGSTGMILASLMLLVGVVGCSQDRFIKGVILIGLAVFFQLLYLPRYFPLLEGKELWQSVENQKVEMFKLMITIACGGAGGSLIAAHAEVSSNDHPKPAESNTQQTRIDYTSQLDAIVKNAEAMNTKINGLMCMCGALFVIIALLLLFRSN
ncbi:hypothetical protein JFU58_09820 [Pseudomonas sp. TH34]|uniref:hypothetical protein n=1 Tax=Pseudomonas sp. TH34 TaxID=2796399 RepID=UPI0019125CFD|nr:hypothetical protein [Pseudomonas sp. TH34]MBK5408836.1 hypothetical protein [Pseudomonas sp. TH34]